MQKASIETTSLFSNVPVVMAPKDQVNEARSAHQALHARQGEPELGVSGQISEIEVIGDLTSEDGGDRWQIYNFEVAGHHTYVADGVRVHNTSTYEITGLREDGTVSEFTHIDPITGERQTIEVPASSSFTPGQLEFYGRVEHDETTGEHSFVAGSFTEQVSGFARSLADILGFDGRFGLQGSFAIDGEGIPIEGSNRLNWSGDKNGDGTPDWRDEKYSNVGNWGGDRDGDGVPNWRDRNDGVGWRDNNTERDEDTDGDGKPIILDMDGDGVEIEVGGTTYFDMDADGFLEQTAWVSSDDAFLVIDLNADGSRGAGDGKINMTQELVFTEWLNTNGVTDLQALSIFDDAEMGGNGDGVLSSADTVWSELRVWQDANSNGEVDAGEMQTLDALGFSQINLTYDDGTAFDDLSNDVEVFGSKLLGSASFTRNGEVITGGVGDVSLKYSAQGWRRVETTDGYTIEFENGENFTYRVMDGSGSANVNLVSSWLDGVTGDARNNSLLANDHTRSVQVSGGDGNDTITGGQMGDALSGDAGADELRGGAGNDLLFFDEFDTVVEGNDGHDTAIYTGDSTVGLNISLTAASIEVLHGSDANDHFSAANGDRAVTVNARGGNDTVIGSHESDLLSGDEGNDSLLGEIGSDTLLGGSGSDTLNGGAGDDLLMGGDGNDTLLGAQGDDDLFGGEGADAFWGGGGGDYLVGGAGDDYLNGQQGDDVLIAGEGNDTIVDELGVNWIEAGNGDDTIRLGHAVNSGGYALTYGSVLGGAGFDTIELQGVASDWTWARSTNANGVDQFILSRGAVKFDIIDIEQLRFLGDNTTVGLNGADASNDNSSQFEVHRDATQWAWLNANWSATSPTNGHELHFGLFGAGTNTGDGTAQNIVGGIGTDIIDGAGGNDTLHGNDGSDILLGGSGNDTLYGGSGSDTLIGGAGADWIDGHEGNDILSGGDGNDTLNGQFGDDVIYGDAGHDTINGGWGSDTIYGGSGNDTLNGERGNDRVEGGDGDDSIIGYTGNDQLVGGNGNDTLHGGLGFDALSGGTGNDILYGNEGDDWLIGGVGADSLLGHSGNDVLEGGVGADSIDGGDGIDTVSYENAASGVYFWIDNSNAANFTGDAVGDVFVGIENAMGSLHDDFIYGSNEHNVLSGLDGNDRIYGRGGNDEVIGGGGNDTLYGHDGLDILRGGIGNDVLLGGTGADQLIGGDGIDRVQYHLATSAVRVDLMHSETNTGEAAGDTFDSIENIWGSNYADDIRGDHEDNVIWGDDGNDILIGGWGADVLNGGAGTDRAMYDSASPSFLADLEYSHLNTGIAVGDTYISIENLHGGSGNDDLRGNQGNNIIWGGAGNDHIHGRKGNDILVGHSGADRFNFNLGWDQDQVNDFEDNVDTIIFRNFDLADVQDALSHATQNGNNVIFDFGGGDTLTVLNTNIAALADDILLF